MDELSAANDKNTKLQNDKKLETKELTERTKSLTDELAKAKNEVQKLRDENYRAKKMLGEKEEKLKAAVADVDHMRKANEQVIHVLLLFVWTEIIKDQANYCFVHL